MDIARCQPNNDSRIAEGRTINISVLDQVSDDGTTIGNRSGEELSPLEKLVGKDASVEDMNALKIGEAVVHPDYGVGLFSGLERIDSGALENEFIVLEYADSEKAYVPVGAMHLLSYYSYNALQAPRLHRLGDDKWQRDKDKTVIGAITTAEQIWQARLKKESRSRPPCLVDHTRYQAFSDSVPFDPTADQVTVIKEVFADLWQPFPMDRVVCGDVGFGKTEIAMHAAFVVADAGLQVAILAPTTLLALQHYRSFEQRFKDQSMSIELLTGALSAAERTRVKEGINEGVVDIVIGTHQVLAKSVRFNALGLLIIDEEHRFGTRHKRRLTRVRKKVDTLSLSATPIPRTLAQAVSGLRELSELRTPIPGRRPVDTLTAPWSDDLVRDACRNEMARGGQVFIVHDRVSSIKRFKRRISKLLPEAKVVHAHGQMKAEKLQRIVQKFVEGDANILVSTTVIESGIDISNANTLIVDQAQQLGLAQLHQLRGRVGRSSKAAYALMLTPSDEPLTHQAQQRLQTLCQANELGAGMSVASGDLEIRGAGELLGDVQSGQCETVGFALYSEWLGRALEQLESNGRVDPDKIGARHVEVDLHTPALLSDTYISDVTDRLACYRRLSRAHSVQQVQAIEQSCESRFGPLPPEARRLFVAAACRLLCDEIGIESMLVDGSTVRFEFDTKDSHASTTVPSLVSIISDTGVMSSSSSHKVQAKLVADNEQELYSLIITILTKVCAEKAD